MLRLWLNRSTAARPWARTRRSVLAMEPLEARTVLSASAVISWQMAPQIGLDPKHGNAPDLPNTSAYVNPAAAYQVLLDASKTPGIQGRSVVNWTIKEAGQTIATAHGRQTSVNLPEGPYTIDLSVAGVRGSSSPAVAEQSIVVRDVLIVAIGDSYASGEGDPVVNGASIFKSAQWAYSPDPTMELENAKAHRSTLAAPAQFALALQKANPQEAVTFVSVANSGATINQGLLGPMVSDVDSSFNLPAQLDEVRQIVGTHRIDVMTVSIGGNDIGFSTRIKELAENSLLDRSSLSAIQTQLSTDLATLPQKYAALGQGIQGLHPGRVLITEYPDPTHNQQGQFAPIRIAGFPAISATNVQYADQNILIPLNQAIATAAASNGWTAVDGLDTPFLTHGYSSTDSWFRSVGQSLRVENSTIGAFHPNLQGQQAVASRLLAVYNQSVVATAQ